jgi:UDP:flavonoid glycosyltransferase YjiC (YdhE family)
MSRILVATVPVIGHIAPLLPLARGLIARGHEVRWYSGRKYVSRIEATGARVVGFVRAPDYVPKGGFLFDGPPRHAVPVTHGSRI